MNMKAKQWLQSLSSRTFHAMACSYDTGRFMPDTHIPAGRYANPWNEKGLHKISCVIIFISSNTSGMWKIKTTSYITWFSTLDSRDSNSLSETAPKLIILELCEVLLVNHLLHYLGELQVENLPARFIENFIEHYVLKGNKRGFKHVKSSLVCKGENRRCLQ